MTGRRPFHPGVQDVVRHGVVLGVGAACALSVALSAGELPPSGLRSVVAGVGLTAWGLLTGAALTAVAAATWNPLRIMVERRMAEGGRRRGRAPGTGPDLPGFRTGAMAVRPVAAAPAPYAGTRARSAGQRCAWCGRPAGNEQSLWCLVCDTAWDGDDYWRAADGWGTADAAAAVGPPRDSGWWGEEAMEDALEEDPVDQDSAAWPDEEATVGATEEPASVPYAAPPGRHRALDDRASVSPAPVGPAPVSPASAASPPASPPPEAHIPLEDIDAVPDGRTPLRPGSGHPESAGAMPGRPYTP